MFWCHTCILSIEGKCLRATRYMIPYSDGAKASPSKEEMLQIDYAMIDGLPSGHVPPAHTTANATLAYSPRTAPPINAVHTMNLKLSLSTNRPPIIRLCSTHKPGQVEAQPISLAGLT